MRAIFTVDRLFEILRCPNCRSCLSRQAEYLVCNSCDHQKFSIIDNVPILLNSNRSIFRAKDFSPKAPTTFKSVGSIAHRIGRFLPSPSRDVGAAKGLQALAQEVEQRHLTQRKVLVVGCGDGSARYGALESVDGVLILETDVSLAGHAQVVCDASDLPFAEGQFDVVICIAVLEHVLEPQRCVDEMHRVLRPDGMIYATTPFMQQVHMGEYDFMRFTRSGHRWLFRRFDEIGSGLATGPASVLVWSVEYFFLSWFKSVAMRRVVKALNRLLLGWLTWLDVLAAQRDAALDAAGGFYFIGRKSTEAGLMPRDMIGYYCGADDRK